MKKFENTINRLKTNYRTVVKIVALPSCTVVANNINGEEMINEFGSVEAFFEDLHTKGYNSLKIYDRVKNGSTFRSDGESYDIDLVAKTESVATENPTTPVAPIVPEVMNMQPQGMNAGMNALMMYQSFDYPKVEAERNTLKTENVALKEKIITLDKQILINDLTNSNAKGSNELMLGMMGHFAPIIGKVSDKIMGNNAVEAVGLSGYEGLSELKKQVLAIVKVANEDQSYYIGEVARNIDNPAFEEYIFEGLEKFKIKVV
jgi:hypothetical protein